MINLSKQKADFPRTVLLSSILRYAFFEVVAVHRLGIGTLSSKWEIILLFFSVAAVAMVLAFTTEERWKKNSGCRERIKYIRSNTTQSSLLLPSMPLVLAIGAVSVIPCT